MPTTTYLRCVSQGAAGFLVSRLGTLGIVAACAGAFVAVRAPLSTPEKLPEMQPIMGLVYYPQQEGESHV